ASRCVRRLLRDREPPYALAGGGIDRIRDGRSHARRPGLAHSSRALRTLDNVDLDSGCLVDAQDLVVAEIGLFNAPILQGDFSVQGCRCSQTAIMRDSGGYLIAGPDLLTNGKAPTCWKVSR